MNKKEMTRNELIFSIQEEIRDMFGWTEDRGLSEDLRLTEDLGFDSLDYPNLITRVEIKHDLGFGILDDCQEEPKTIGELADAMLIRVQAQVVIS